MDKILTILYTQFYGQKTTWTYFCPISFPDVDYAVVNKSIFYDYILRQTKAL